jgi:probable HAF family extracellular repeat protein
MPAPTGSAPDSAAAQAVAQHESTDGLSAFHQALGSMLNLHGTGTCVTGCDVHGRRVHLCFAPGTPPWYVDYVSRVVFGGLDQSLAPTYYLWVRWTQTSYGGTDAYGSPIRLRWSVVPDGTNIPHYDPNIGPAPSALRATLDAQFGNQATWWNLLRQCFARWSEVAGVRYEEVGDDGAPFPASPGSPARGDVRISGRALDGPGGVLAFNYYPDWGDMVIDTSDNWANPANNFRSFRNLVMHEHGHGLGLAHVIPTDCTKLMEPFLCTNFDGPQDDDIRGAQRLYGDRYETNDRFERATPVYLGGSENVTLDVSLHSTRDVDWFLIQIPRDTSLTITAVPIGATYDVGPEGGNPVTVNTRAVQDLVLELRASDARTILMMANANGRGGTEQITNYGVPGGGSVYLRVYSGSASLDDVQRYELRLRSTAVPGIFIPLGFLPGGVRESEAYGVSWDGNVVVGRAKNSAGHWRAVRWTLADGQIQELGTLGGNASAATAVSADGWFVVGWSDHEGCQRAFRWTPGGGMQYLGTFWGHSPAWGVSADGRVVVGWSDGLDWLNNRYVHAFRWTQAGGMQSLGSGAAYHISADGSVVVGGFGRAFRWTVATGMQDLGTLGGDWSEAYGVSADGSVIVGSARDAAGWEPAFRWTAATGMQNLGALPGDTWCRAYAVSADGRIVVGQSRSGAFIWTPETGMRYLRDVFAHLIPPGWELTMARGMSPDGRFIVGWGLNPRGEEEAWLLDPLLDPSMAGFRITGNVELRDFVGDVTRIPVDVEIRSAGSVVRSQTLYLDASGNYTLYQVPSGTYDVAFKASHWLRAVVPDVRVTGDVSGVNVSLLNGDVDGDNEVTLFDFGKLVAAFGSTPGDGNWYADADLDGDDEVTLFDFGILVRNFGLFGDE